MRFRAMSLATAALVTAAGLVMPAYQPASAAPPGSKGVTATLFQWKFSSVAKECTQTLGPKGYGYVEVSPASAHVQGAQWWTSYQPVSYTLTSRLGTRSDFKAMIDTCNAAGVKVIADAVINHMSAGSGTGTDGSSYTKYRYPAHYSDADFHTCRTNVSDYTNRDNVQNCELVGLADLDTGDDYVRSEIAEYLNDLISLGVSGFRIDAAKHISATDLAAIKGRLSDPNVFWVNEVIYGAGEAVQPAEYTGTGDVDEFRGAYDLKRIFTNEKLEYLETWGESWGYLPGGKARTFVDNWDTERNGSTLNYRYGSTYTLANVFMLAHPYGSPNVYSGYEFSDNDAGAPNGGTVDACYSDGWKCQHKWPQIANMVGFRNAVSGTSLTHWWDNGNDAIAFGRGGKGYVAINGESSPITRTFTTSLPAGTYCDVQHGDPANNCAGGPAYTVGSDGRFTATVGAGDAVALHVGAGATSASPAPGASFAVDATTAWGENVHVTGGSPALGNWAPADALPLSPAAYPAWTLDVPMAAGTSFEYKYLKKDAAGKVTWEAGPNRTAAVPSAGKVTLNDTWRS